MEEVRRSESQRDSARQAEPEAKWSKWSQVEVKYSNINPKANKYREAT